MMVWEYFTHFHKSALCYTDVHVYRATSHKETESGILHNSWCNFQMINSLVESTGLHG